MHRLAAGHFAVEDSLNEIAESMHRFYLDDVRRERKRNARMSERRRAGGDESRHGSVGQRRYAAAVRI